MRKPVKRTRRPLGEPLERRCLLSGITPTGQWIGQDLQDFVGRSSTPQPNGIQDIRITLKNLPVDREIVSADVRGHGGGHWVYQGSPGPWAAALIRSEDATRADLFIEPYQVETGRTFSVDLQYDDGTKAQVYFAGGEADPILRMPAVKAQAHWIGQDGTDRVGNGVAVGPDGFQDARISLSNLSADVEIQRILIQGPSGLAWQYGTNLQADQNAELIRRTDDPSRADLFLQADRDLGGKELSLLIQYSNGTSDLASLTAGSFDPYLPVASVDPLPIRADSLSVNWQGQSANALGIAQRGDVRLTLSGLPTDREVVTASLGNGYRGGTWAYSTGSNHGAHVEPSTQRLSFARSLDRSAAELAFPPIRDESGSNLTLRLTYDDGSISIFRFAGGPSDPGLKAPLPDSTSRTAQPSDNLQALANQFGALHLSAGQYALDQPLVLNRPITITADPGATLLFSQPSNAPTWTSAIKIHHGHTTLDGFAIRFSGPIRWNWNVPYDPAVIGTTDAFDGTSGGIKVGLAITNLNIEGPTPSKSGELAVKLMRLVSAESGRIANNRLKGGTTQFRRGPWEVVGNDYRGTVPGTFAFEVFAAHQTIDLVLRDNTARPDANSGKTYRFLVLTVSGSNDLVAGNVVSGIGPMDADLTPPPNAPEIILTEAYRLSFEGRPSKVSNDGRIVQIPFLQGQQVRTGDVVSVLSGPQAGRWSRVASVLGPTAFLLEDPLPIGSGPEVSISIAAGFVEQAYRNNSIDVTGSSTAAPLVLVGAHFGTEVLKNTLIGGSGSRIIATVSESPIHWGWSHTPSFDFRIEGNTFQDGAKGTTLGLEHGSAVKSNKGRLYFSAALENNVIAFSPSFLANWNGQGHPIGLSIGHPLAIDPGESRISKSGNLFKLPEGVDPLTAIQVLGATINGVEVVSQNIQLSALELASPANLALVHDSGFDSNDRITNDARLRFDLVGGAWGYEYRVSQDASGPFLPIPDAPWFLPEGLAQGENTVWVRAIDDFGRRGQATSLTFTYDTIAPEPPTLALRRGSDTGLSDSDRITRDTSPIFDLFSSGGNFVSLRVGGVEVARREGPGPLGVPGPLSDGVQEISALQIDRAGNTSASVSLLVVIDTIPPDPVTGLIDLGDGRVRFDRVEGAALYEYRVGNAPYQPLGDSNEFQPEGLSPGLNGVFVRAMDLAGNIGPESALVVTLPLPPSPTPPLPPQIEAEWVGQDGHDLVGPWPWFEAPDGIQDIRINLHNLPADRSIIMADVLGHGGGRWQFNSPQDVHWKLAVVRAPGSTSASLFFQPYQFETGRSYHVIVHLDDGTINEMYLDGGPVDPTMSMPPLPTISAPGRPGLGDLGLISITPLADAGSRPKSPGSPGVASNASGPSTESGNLGPRARRALELLQARMQRRGPQHRPQLPRPSGASDASGSLATPSKPVLQQRPWVTRWLVGRSGKILK